MIYEKVDRNKIALIHAAKAEVKMTEDNYRTVLKSRFNVTTSKDLTIPQFKALMEIFEKLGYKSKYLTRKQLSNILNKAKIYWGKDFNKELKAFIKKQTGQEKQLGRLLVKEAQDVINGLDKMIDWKNKGKKTW